MRVWVLLVWWACGWLGLVLEVHIHQTSRHGRPDEMAALEARPDVALPLALLVSLLGPIELFTVAGTFAWAWARWRVLLWKHGRLVKNRARGPSNV